MCPMWGLWGLWLWVVTVAVIGHYGVAANADVPPSRSPRPKNHQRGTAPQPPPGAGSEPEDATGNPSPRAREVEDGEKCPDYAKDYFSLYLRHNSGVLAGAGQDTALDLMWKWREGLAAGNDTTRRLIPVYVSHAQGAGDGASSPPPPAGQADSLLTDLLHAHRARVLSLRLEIQEITRSARVPPTGPHAAAPAIRTSPILRLTSAESGRDAIHCGPTGDGDCVTATGNKNISLRRAWDPRCRRNNASLNSDIDTSQSPAREGGGGDEWPPFCLPALMDLVGIHDGHGQGEDAFNAPGLETRHRSGTLSPPPHATAHSPHVTPPPADMDEAPHLSGTGATTTPKGTHISPAACHLDFGLATGNLDRAICSLSQHWEIRCGSVTAQTPLPSSSPSTHPVTPHNHQGDPLARQGPAAAVAGDHVTVTSAKLITTFVVRLEQSTAGDPRARAKRGVDPFGPVYTTADEDSNLLAAAFGGILQVDIVLDDKEINQCDFTSASIDGHVADEDLKILRHKCGGGSKCVPNYSKGVTLGAYTCTCPDLHCAGTPTHNTTPGHTSTPPSPLSLEQDAFRTRQGLPRLLNNATFSCLTCPTNDCYGNASPFTQLLSDNGCAISSGMVLRIVLVTITIVAMSGVFVIFGLVCRNRRDKVVRAASPLLLYVALAGALLLYAEVLAAAFPPSAAVCAARPWLRHLGFCVTYGALLIKTWRISVIMRVFKSRMLRTRDTQLVRSLLLIVLLCGVYMTVWTVADPVLPAPMPAALAREQHHSTGSQLCMLSWWEICIVSGEICFLAWGGVLCYRARKAPDVYNETQPTSYSLWNEAIWNIVYIYVSLLLRPRPDGDMWFILVFLRTQATCTTTVLLLFAPKFSRIFSSLRELRGTVTDVYGARRVHRLSLMVSRNGAVRTIYCVPCGPLAYADPGHDDGDSDGESEVGGGDGGKEMHYTKAEVDALIEMVSRLKSEKELYKTQAKRLYMMLKEHRSKIPNGLPVYLVAETPEAEEGGVDVPGAARKADWRNDFPTASSSAYSMRTGLLHDLPTPTSALDPFAAALGSANFPPVTPSRKASTVTTYLSSTPENGSVSGCGDHGESPELCSDCARTVNTNPFLNMNQTLRRSVSGGISSTSLSAPRPCCKVCRFPDAQQLPVEAKLLANGQAHVHDLIDMHDKESCADEQDLENIDSASMETDDFPRILQGHDSNCNNKHQTDEQREISEFIATVCGPLVDRNKPKHGGQENHADSCPPTKPHELQLLGHSIEDQATSLGGAKHRTRSTSVVNSDQTQQPTTPTSAGAKSPSDKMSFVMYI